MSNMTALVFFLPSLAAAVEQKAGKQGFLGIMYLCGSILVKLDCKRSILKEKAPSSTSYMYIYNIPNFHHSIDTHHTHNIYTCVCVCECVFVCVCVSISHTYL